MTGNRNILRASKAFRISLCSKEENAGKSKNKNSTYFCSHGPISQEDGCFLVTQEESIFVLNLDYDCAPDEEESSQPNQIDKLSRATSKWVTQCLWTVTLLSILCSLEF